MYKNLRLTVLGLLSFMIVSCEESTNEVTLFEKGTIAATPSSSSIVSGESITFTDNSTKVQKRSWSFTGGTPATSTDPTVTVVYAKGGSYVATLNVTYVDNQTAKLEFPIEVEGKNEAPVSGYGIYSENSGLTVTPPTLQINNAYEITEVGDAFEGAKALKFAFTKVDTWGVMGSVKPAGGTANISEYATGYYNVAIKTLCTKNMRLRLQGGGQNSYVTLSEAYGFKSDGEWHALKIPIADFLANNPAVNLGAISDFLVLRSGESAVLASEEWDFYVDHVYLSKE